MGKKKKEREKEKEKQDGSDQPAKKVKLAPELDPPESPPPPPPPPPVASEDQAEDNAKDEHKEQIERMQLLVSAFSNDQEDQYEIFRRSTFPKSTIRKLMQSVCSGSVPQNAVIAMAGVAKVYVGEIVEAACQARDAMNEEGPLQPKHIREATRKLRQLGKIPNSRHKRQFTLK